MIVLVETGDLQERCVKFVGMSLHVGDSVILRGVAVTRNPWRES